MSGAELAGGLFRDSSAYCLQLRNEDRTCYSNSAVALITSLTTFQGFLSKHRHSSSEILQELMALSQVPPGSVRSTGRLRQLVTNINNDNNNWTMTGREHDVTEFIHSLVKALETELADDSESVCDLRTLFRTETQRELKCQNDVECGALVRPPADLQFPVFHLPIEGCHSLQESFDKYFYTTDGSEMGSYITDYTCEVCSRSIFQQEREWLTVAPTVLVVRLERYTQDGGKDRRPLDIPRQIQPYPDSPHYKLAGASKHHGQSLHSGHYTSLIITDTGAFLLSDDAAPREIFGKNVDQELSTSFVIFYQQTQEVDRSLDLLSPVMSTPRQTAGEDSEDEVRGVKKKVRVLSSSEDESSSTLDKKKFVRKNLGNVFDDITNSEEMKSKKAIREEKLRKLAKKRNPKRRFPESSDDEQENEEEEYDQLSGSSGDIKLKEVTRIFLSKYYGHCQLESCRKKFIKGRTKIMGVEILHPPTESNPGRKPHWVCARHSQFVDIESDQEEQTEGDSEWDSDSSGDLTDFIDDSPEDIDDCDDGNNEVEGDYMDDRSEESDDCDEGNNEVDDDDMDDSSEQSDDCDEGKKEVDDDDIDESGDSNYAEDEEENDDGSGDLESELCEITRSLSRRRPEDLQNKENYLEQLGKYQLQIHTETNPALYLSEEKRKRRHRRLATRDLGLNQDRGIEAGDIENQESRQLYAFGQKFIVFPTKIRQSRFNTKCEVCKADIRKNVTLIVPAKLAWRSEKLEFNSLKKPFYICAAHVSTE